MSIDWLAGEVTTLALCWRIERRDGVAIGLTSHDRDLVRDGLIYRAAPGMTPSAIQRSDALDADTMEVRGAIDHGTISATDLIAGRWDGARVTITAVDWTQPGHQAVPLGEGEIGAVELADTGFAAELTGIAALLDAPASEETSPTCRAELGDRRCRVAMAARARVGQVTDAQDKALTLDIAEPVANGWAGGRIRWLTGANSGLAEEVVASDGNVVTLRRPPRFASGDARIEITEGCDKRLETCRDRFANAANFRGEPHLPGIDLLTRYPGG